MKYRNQLIKPFLSGAGVSEDAWARAFGTVYKNKQLEEIRTAELDENRTKETMENKDGIHPEHDGRLPSDR